MNGLGDYDSNTGYALGAIFMMQTVTFNYSRKWKLSINSMNSEETLGLTFAKLIAELLRTKAIPEQDAFRFARYANLAEIKISGNISTGAEVLEALQTAIIKMIYLMVKYLEKRKEVLRNPLTEKISIFLLQKNLQ